MKRATKTKQELVLELEDLRARLEEAEETLRAIRSGEVDALVVSGAEGEQIFTLKGAEQPYRVLIETMNEGAVTLTTDGTILYCNNRFAEMLKTPLQQVTGSSVYPFIALTDEKVFEAMLQEGGERRRSEIYLQAEDGTLIPAFLSVTPLEMEGTRAICMVVTDLTEQKRTEEIVKAERLSRSILDQATEAIVICDKKGQIIRASQMAHELSAKNLLFQHFDNIFPLRISSEGDFKSSEFSILAPLNGKVLRAIEVSFRRDDGKVFNLLLSARPLLDQKNTIHGCVVTLVDITERKQAEQERERLRIKAENEERRLEAVMDALPVGVAITDNQGGNIRSNKAFEQIWGTPRPAAASVADYAAYKAWWSETGKLVAPEEWASAQAVEKGQAVVGQLLEIQRFDGSRASIINSGAPIFDADGKVAGCAVAIQDITDLRKAEQALRKSKERFELLSETASKLLATDKPQEIVNELCKKVMTYLDCHALFNYLVDEEKGRLHLNAYAGIPKEIAKEIEWLDYGVAVCGCAARDASRIVAEDILNTPDPRTEIVKSFGIKAYACHPLFSAGRVIGTLSFGTRSRTTFTEEELSLMKTVADQVATAMERMRLIEALRRSRDELEMRVRERTAELAKANALLERMFSSIDISVAYMDKDFNFIRVNRAYAEADDQEPEFYVGKNHFVLFPNEENQQIFRKVVETGESYSVFAKPFEYAEHHERGVTYWDWSLQPVKETDGSIGGVVLSLVNVTERIRAQEAVAAERQRFNDVLEILPAYLILLSPDYHVPFANRFFRERFGESQGRRCFEYLFDRSEPCEICETYTVMKTKAPHNWEWTGPDGRIYDVYDFPFIDRDGSTLIMEMGIDINERKRAEEALKSASLYTRSLIEASLDPLVTISTDGKIMDVNKTTEVVTGVSREDLIGTDFSNYFTEPEKARQGYRQVFSKGFVTDYPLAIRNISGKVTEVLYNAGVYKNENGEVQGVFAVARDITERKKVEDSLREREALLRTVFETLPVGVWITDKQGRIIRGNPAGQQIWAGARYVGIDQFGEYKGWWVDTGKRIEPEEWAAARAVLKGETSINEEIEIECFDGSHKIILNSAVPIRDERQGILGAFIVNQDITEHKRTEKAIRQMQKMEALGTLAGGIAHDFNNILMPIVINTELALLDTPEGSSLSNYLKLVQEAANRGKDLIKQIITFSRQKEQVKAPIEIGPVLKETLKFLRSSIPKNVEIRENIEMTRDSVLADPTQIHQVLMNLCSNAAYAMREKGGVLDISLTPVEVDADMVNRHLELKPGPYLRLTVADTGQGMDKEVMEKAFDPFFTTKKSGEGTGMGLAVVHGIVKNHGGAIIAYSEVEKGSTFNVFLPMIKEELKAETAPSKTITTGKERILLVDDEEIQIRSVQPMLERLGYRVISKTDAIEALDIFRLQSNEFDLVITDQTMPRMTGRELAEELLRIRPDIPIILCTGFSEVIHEEEAKAMGIREFIMKPFSLNEMAGIIRKSLERNG